jgi:hypothetical protein
MNGIHFVTDEKGRRVAIQIDLKKYGALLEDFWDGLICESRRKEQEIPYEEYRANRLRRGRPAAKYRGGTWETHRQSRIKQVMSSC